MIEMQIHKDVDKYGASIYKLTPSAIKIGNENAHNVDTLHFDIPFEWLTMGLTIRATFIPSKYKAEAIAMLVPEDGIIEINSSTTIADGILVVDAFGQDIHYYTDNARYSIVNHKPVGGEEPEYNPTQIEQFLSQAQQYSNASIEARDKAEEYAEQTQADREEIEEIKTEIDVIKIDFDEKKADFDSKLIDFGINYEEKVEEFNQNARSKTTAFNQNATSKQNQFNSNATSKQNDFDANALLKRDWLDSQAQGIAEQYERDAERLTGEFNSNASAKTTEFNNLVADKKTEIVDLAEEKKEEISALVPDISMKMEKHLLSYDGTHIIDNGVNLDFNQLYNILMTSPDFAVLVYQNYAYHPNGVSTEQIVFSASYPVNGMDANHRITMLKNGTVTKTDATDENVINKVNAITELNKADEKKYPSLKAVTGYIAKEISAKKNYIYSPSRTELLTLTGKYITVNGVISPSANWNTSELIRVSVGDVLEYKLYSHTTVAINICAYDNDEAFMKSLVKDNNFTATVGEACRFVGTIIVDFDGFVRISSSNGHSDIYFYLNKNLNEFVDNKADRTEILEERIIDSNVSLRNDTVIRVSQQGKEESSDLWWLTSDYLKTDDYDGIVINSSGRITDVFIIYYDSNKTFRSYHQRTAQANSTIDYRLEGNFEYFRVEWRTMLINGGVVTADEYKKKAVSFIAKTPELKHRLLDYSTFISEVGSTVYFETSGQDVYVKFDGNWFVRGLMYTTVIMSNIGKTLALETSPNGITNCLKIPHNHMLTCDWNNYKLVSIENRKKVEALDEFVIFQVSKGRVVGGHGLPYYTEFVAKEIAINTINELPSYWTTYLNSKADALKTLAEQSDECFMFVTDLHTPNNTMHSPSIIKWVQKNTGINKVLVGGDFETLASTSRLGMDMIDAYLSIGDYSWLYARGNHDTNYQGTGEVTSKAFYNRAIKPNTSNAVPMIVGKPTYYIDDKTSKFRYIILDTANESSDEIPIAEQVDWMKERILELDASWSVIVMTHKYFAPSPISEGKTDVTQMNIEVTQIKSGLDSVIPSASATVVAYICGHVHRDLSIKSDKGYWIISTTCDASQVQASYWDIYYPTRTRGTKDEQVVDVYGINKTNRTIKTVRLGAGAESREWTY